MSSNLIFRLKIKMNIDFILFHLFAFFVFIPALMVVTLSNAVHSVLFLIIVFCNVASLLLILGAEFFSFMFLIVYVGAIAVLFLFVVMMLNIKISPMRVSNFSIIPIGIIFFCILINFFLICNTNFFFKLKNLNFLIYLSWFNENYYLTNVEVIGKFLYTKFSLLFFFCGLILLVAMIGVIVLTMHQRPTVRKQEISVQLLRNHKGVIKFIELRK